MRQQGKILIAVCAALGALTPQAQATTVMAVPLERMTRESAVIVHARVGEQRVTWDKTHSRILTLTTIEIINSVKGSAKGRLETIYQVGGSLDGKTFKIPGAYRFRLGEEIILFGVRLDDMIVSYGMGLGKYRVESEGSARVVIPEYGDVVFVERSKDGRLLPGNRPSETAVPLGRFLHDIRAIANGQGGGR